MQFITTILFHLLLLLLLHSSQVCCLSHLFLLYSRFACSMRDFTSACLPLLLPLLMLIVVHTAAAQLPQLNDALATQLADADAEVQAESAAEANAPHIRKKRLIWITDDGRLALPPGTSLTFTPTIAMPLVRHPPEGFFSNLTISFPVTSE